MKIAVVNCADTHPAESLRAMLETAGYHCYFPDDLLQRELVNLGCDTVLDPKYLVRSWGYLAVNGFGIATRDDMETCDLYVDVKAHRNGPLIWKKWPRLKGKTLWYRINGGKPEHVIRADGFDCGDEVNPPCPVLTPNQWYRQSDCPPDINWCRNSSYVMWPPFVRIGDYDVPRRDKATMTVKMSEKEAARFTPAMCLIHNVNGWGYRDLVEPVREIGVNVHGVGSPDGLINNREVPIRLTSALAYVHLKSNDAPGYALYEALASGCPVVCSRRLIWRCRMEALLQEGVTCLCFDRETHDALTPSEVISCRDEIKKHLTKLADPGYNDLIGEAGRARLKQVMWSSGRISDVESFKTFMTRNFS